MEFTGQLSWVTKTEKTIALSQVTDKLQYIKLYQVSHSTGRDYTHYFSGDIVVVRDVESVNC
jgi:hypothetical protein